jgi:hypothetical protein
MKWFYHSNLSSCGRRAERVAKYSNLSLQFAKAGSAAMLPQQEKSHSADVQRGGFIPRGDVPGR